MEEWGHGQIFYDPRTRDDKQTTIETYVPAWTRVGSSAGALACRPTNGLVCPDLPKEQGSGGMGPRPNFLRPEDSGRQADNDRNLRACLDSCRKFGWRLSLQTHKWLGLS